MTMLTIIIVNWNTANLLNNCVKSIVESYGYKYNIIVVDNGSTDESVKLIQSNFPKVKLLCNKDNLGFAKANNLAIKVANTEFICLLNSDTVINGDSISNMLQYMDLNGDVVACGPALRLPNGRLQTGGAGYELCLVTAFNYFMLLSRIFPFLFRGMYIDQNSYVKKGPPVAGDWLAGACPMFRRTAYEKVGGLDESYFMYAEDAEWCARLKSEGKIIYLPSVEILHYHGASSESSMKISTKWLDATFRYFLTKTGESKFDLFRYIVVYGFAIRYILYLMLSLKNESYVNQAKAMLCYLKHSWSWSKEA